MIRSHGSPFSAVMSHKERECPDAHDQQTKHWEQDFSIEPGMEHDSLRFFHTSNAIVRAQASTGVLGVPLTCALSTRAHTLKFPCHFVRVHDRLTEVRIRHCGET
jgi:hypothetical protein